ncbi:helix-turn-helix domain-containing protein [Ramlibacter terrae]|uniref:Helix-turn-helix domain-containing protein n=1 Tax=Ramlibacter terrae TaxID=2732511 RepID=A0ABX6P1E1_9BURK|nr:helix-turn-helix domain-containing protein [Ramlibacter terrae]
MTLPSATLRQLLGGSQLAGELGASFVLSAMGDDVAADCAGLFARLAAEFRAQQAGRAHALLACATLLAVQMLRLRGEQFERERLQGARDTLVQRYAAPVEQHFRAHRPLAFYADALGVTADHLSRTCRNVARQSALQLLHERVLLEARRLLAYTPMPVTEIAAQLGYDDAAYFSKFFSRSVGHTPSAWRALVAKGVMGAVGPA